MSSSLHSGQSLASLVVGADWYILVVMVTSHQAIILGTGQQTCQGPEMKMRETVRHSGEGAIFFGGGALPVMRPLAKLFYCCLHSCCRTEEIKFSIKPITRKPIQNL